MPSSRNAPLCGCWTIFFDVFKDGFSSLVVDVVREDDPGNNVPDTIFSKIGLQLHRRDTHPIGILKNAIFDYLVSNYSSRFVKFDDLCPIVSVKEVESSFFFHIFLPSHCYSTLSEHSQLS